MSPGLLLHQILIWVPTARSECPVGALRIASRSSRGFGRPNPTLARAFLLPPKCSRSYHRELHDT
jgi:hypothetical protein